MLVTFQLQSTLFYPKQNNFLHVLHFLQVVKFFLKVGSLGDSHKIVHVSSIFPAILMRFDEFHNAVNTPRKRNLV